MLSEHHEQLLRAYAALGAGTDLVAAVQSLLEERDALNAELATASEAMKLATLALGGEASAQAADVERLKGLVARLASVDPVEWCDDDHDDGEESYCRWCKEWLRHFSWRDDPTRHKTNCAWIEARALAAGGATRACAPESSIAESFEALRKAGGDAWDRVGDVEEYLGRKDKPELSKAALSKLNPIEAWVIREWYGLGELSSKETPSYFHRTRQELSHDCGLSVHRIQEVERSALAKLRDIVANTKPPTATFGTLTTVGTTGAGKPCPDCGATVTIEVPAQTKHSRCMACGNAWDWVADV